MLRLYRNPTKIWHDLNILSDRFADNTELHLNIILTSQKSLANIKNSSPCPIPNPQSDDNSNIRT
ncbi:MAG: hypothetical protein V7K42_01650 [Nostoc sp.]